MSKDEFYDSLNTAITVGCQLPFSIPEVAMDNIVKYAAEWFYRNWDDAVDNIYLSIPKEVWKNNEEFRKTRKLTLPHCIYSVNHLAKDKRTKNNIGGSGDFALGKYMESNWGVNGGFSGIEDTTQSDAVLGYVISASWGDLTYHILNFPMSYSFNRQTRKLFFKGSFEENPDFLLDCDVRAPLEALYELDLFFNYCYGQIMMSLANIMGTFQMALPGGATIDYSRYYDQGKEKVDDVKEEVKSMRGGSDFFLHTNNM